jgi:hypothetical protein
MSRVAEALMPEAFEDTECPLCHGDGFITVQAAPTFSEREGQWYPAEDEEPCPRCR